SIDAVPDTIIFVFQRPAVRHLAARPGCIYGGPLKNKNFPGGIAFYTQVTPNGVTKTPGFSNLFKNKPLILPDSKPLPPHRFRTGRNFGGKTPASLTESVIFKCAP